MQPIRVHLFQRLDCSGRIRLVYQTRATGLKEKCEWIFVALKGIVSSPLFRCRRPWMSSSCVIVLRQVEFVCLSILFWTHVSIAHLGNVETSIVFLHIHPSIQVYRLVSEKFDLITWDWQSMRIEGCKIRSSNSRIYQEPINGTWKKLTFLNVYKSRAPIMARQILRKRCQTSCDPSWGLLEYSKRVHCEEMKLLCRSQEIRIRENYRRSGRKE